MYTPVYHKHISVGAGIALTGFTVMDMHWVPTASGLSAYMTWNLLMIVVLILIWRYNRKDERNIKIR